MNFGGRQTGEINSMISLTENMLIFSDNKLIPAEGNISSLSSSPQCCFNTPEKALMNVLRTPQLESTETISSPDYEENNSRADTGYSPAGFTFSNQHIFNLSNGDD